MTNNVKAFKDFPCTGLAVDPIHVGTGGTRLGRVDNTIVRDPVTKVPKIPGSSLAGVYRAYAAMAKQEKDPERKDANGQPQPYYPDCAGQGAPQSDGAGGHCGQATCAICAVFGHVTFAGLAAFSDAQVLLFPVATREGPVWVTCPEALRAAGVDGCGKIDDNTVYRDREGNGHLNLGWLLLPAKPWNGDKKPLEDKLDIPCYITERLALVSDKLFTHVVNSNLEVRTSVSINPATGAAEDGALFTYEALPRGTVLHWTITCRNPKHFARNNDALKTPDCVHGVANKAHCYLKALGVGGMGARGMGRVRVPANGGGDTPCAEEAEQCKAEGVGS